MQAFRPDVVLGYSNPVLNPVRRLARELGARNVFYLANPAYTEKKRAYFQEVDTILVPSAALGAHYKDTLGLETEVTRDLVPQHIDPASFSVEAKTAVRRQGFVTLINPSPEKGGTLLLRLSQMALKQAPELTFLGVESRGSRTFWESRGINTGARSNLWWIPKQKDIARVYARTSVLLVPSLWFEASARVVAEAQLCGIPVLATRRGGIPDQLNGGGFLFDMPPTTVKKGTRAMPTAEEMQPWLDRITALMEDADAYRAACTKALEAAAPFRPKTREKALVAQFRRLAGKD